MPKTLPPKSSPPKTRVGLRILQPALYSGPMTMRLQRLQRPPMDWLHYVGQLGVVTFSVPANPLSETKASPVAHRAHAIQRFLDSFIIVSMDVSVDLVHEPLDRHAVPVHPRNASTFSLLKKPSNEPSIVMC